MNEANDRFIEMMGRHFEEEGVPRIAGRLFGLLMLVERETSLDELAEGLRVSKGSVSAGTRRNFAAVADFRSASWSPARHSR